jgi:hypothetical protein
MPRMVTAKLDLPVFVAVAFNLMWAFVSTSQLLKRNGRQTECFFLLVDSEICVRSLDYSRK